MLNRVLETNPDQRQLYHNVQKKNALMHHLIQMTLKNVRLRCAIYILIFYIYHFQRMDCNSWVRANLQILISIRRLQSIETKLLQYSQSSAYAQVFLTTHRGE